MNICLKCGAEVSPSEYCASCGARTVDVARSRKGIAEPSGDRLAAATQHIVDLLREDKNCSLVGILLLVGTVASLILNWMPLGVLCFLTIIPITLYKFILHFRIVSARNDETKLLRMLSSGNRVCATCRAMLPPSATSCSSCGGEDIRVTGLEDIRIPIAPDQTSTTIRTKHRGRPTVPVRMTLAALVVAIGVVGVFAVIAVLTGAFEKQKASIPDQVLPPHGSCPILETLQVAIGNESGYSEYERYFCIDGTQHLSLLLHDGKLIPLTLEGWRNGWPDRGFVLPRGAFVLVTNGGLKLNSSEWSSFIAEHQTDQRITVIKALCKLKIPVLTDEGYANEDTFSGPEGSYQALKFGNACASLVKPTDELATSESRSPNVRRVPFVGCKSDGQGGPVEAPKGESKVVPIDPTAAQRIAYYATGKDFGVLAPRGWHCFGSYGSNGTNLYVSPQPINTNIEPSVFAGPVIELSLASGDTSGRFDVAKVIARVFPAHMAFVRRVIEGGEEPTSSFPLGPYPNDKLNYRSSEIVEYQTPARTGGLGTVSLLQSNADPISGVAILTGQDPDLLQLSVRLSPEQVDLAPTIIQQVERDVAGQPQSLTSTPPRTPWVITLNGVSALPGHQPASAGVGTDSGLQTVGEGVSAPVPLNSVEATYSDEARRAKVQGVCLVSVNVDTQGNPQNPRVVRSLGKGLDENAIEAVKRYRFKPAMKGGRTPVPVRITVEVRFSLY